MIKLKKILNLEDFKINSKIKIFNNYSNNLNSQENNSDKLTSNNFDAKEL